MTIADDDQNPRPGKKLSKSLDAIAALRIAMEQRLAEAQRPAEPVPEPIPPARHQPTPVEEPEPPHQPPAPEPPANEPVVPDEEPPSPLTPPVEEPGAPSEEPTPLSSVADTATFSEPTPVIIETEVQAPGTAEAGPQEASIDDPATHSEEPPVMASAPMVVPPIPVSFVKTGIHALLAAQAAIPAADVLTPEQFQAAPSASSSEAAPAPETAGSNSTNPREAFSFGTPEGWSRIMFRIADSSQKLIDGYLRRQKDVAPALPTFDPGHILDAIKNLTSRVLNDPERFTEAQVALWQGYIKIWQQTLARMSGAAVEPIVSPTASDKRFKDKDWQNIWLFDFIKQSYLLTSQWVHGFVKEEAGKLDRKSAQKLDFYSQQFLDAMAPSNFWLTNPEVLRTTFESGGENLVRGLENLLHDMERGGGQLNISMADLKAFKVGHNLATTPGQVVFRNRMIELIQYAPSTAEVNRTPLLIIPPWINKYYILDMREKNSLIRYLVAQGHTVFCVSWVNPDATYADTHFDDYMNDGLFAALREIKNITGEDTVNPVGYCIGGTLLASGQAYLNAVEEQPSGLPAIASATYFVTMVDFAEPGDLGVFIDEEQIGIIEERMKVQGYLDAASMATTFNLLRSNDLIWSFVINNYLLGKEPFPFDILFWNNDSTNLPAAMHSFYLRQMYLENRLAKPNGLTMKDVPIDLTTISTPSFLLATREDHIAPWRSTYAATQIYKGPLKFVLAGSGHISGVVNPPSANKYGYWTNDLCPADPEKWLAQAEPHKGSWWPEWMKWLETYSGGKVPAREVKNGLDAAPGSYVLTRAIQ